jgi:protein SCO1/2
MNPFPLAAAKKRVYIDRYGRRGAEQGWAFTGDPQPIKRLADAIGFQYAYDPELRQYAHPAVCCSHAGGPYLPLLFFGAEYSPGTCV